MFVCSINRIGILTVPAATVSITVIIKTAFLVLLSAAARTRVVPARFPGVFPGGCLVLILVINPFTVNSKLSFYLFVSVIYIEQFLFEYSPSGSFDLLFNFTQFSTYALTDITEIKKRLNFR